MSDSVEFTTLSVTVQAAKTSQEEVSAQRKPRKSVAFSEGATVVDSNGDVTEMNGTSDKTTAERHTGMSPHLQSQATKLMHDAASPSPSAAPVATTDKDVDEVTDLFKGLSKKKKPKKPKEGEDVPAAADADFDPSALKKKKKKKTTKTDDGDFEKKLAEANVGEGAEETQDAEGTSIEEGDMEKGTGIWAHDATQAISYPLLLTRFFAVLQDHHPDLMASGTKSHKIPPPQCLREGNKKTIFANIADICKRMKRTDEHVTQFLFAELGTNGSVDGSRRLVIKGRFQQKQIENVVRRYIGEDGELRVCFTQDADTVQSNMLLAKLVVPPIPS